MWSELRSATIYRQQSVCCVGFNKQDLDDTTESFLFSLGEMEKQKIWYYKWWIHSGNASIIIWKGYQSFHYVIRSRLSKLLFFLKYEFIFNPMHLIFNNILVLKISYMITNCTHVFFTHRNVWWLYTFYINVSHIITSLHVYS